MTLRTEVRHHANKRAYVEAPLARRCSACLPAGDTPITYIVIALRQVSFHFSPAHRAGFRANKAPALVVAYL
jgi:hypothetical protein